MASGAIALKFLLSLGESAAGGVVSKVASLATDQFSLKIVFSFSKELDQLKRSSTRIEKLIHDAALEPEDPELWAMADWMKSLMTVAYDAEDVVDEVQYEAARIDIEGTILDKCIRRIFVRLQMAGKIDNINKSLENLFNQAPSVLLVTTRRSNGGAASSQGMQVWETISLPEKHEFSSRDAKIFGREKVVSDITATLNNPPNNEEKMPLVMAVVGLPGVGKTTLARLLTEQLMKEGKMKKPFDIPLWVHVSKNFDVKSILRRMLKLCEATTANPETLEELVPSLRKKLKGKRYFLVLDDVWNENAQIWKDLKQSLGYLESADGSTVIVTTRSGRVADIMRTPTLTKWDLRTLSDDQCWSIIQDRAFDIPNPSIDSEQKRIGTEIAKKCAGLPLAAKILGSLMHSKNSKEWGSILESPAWRNQKDSEIMPALKLSFDSLKSPLKLCFAYCSMLDRGSLIEKEELVQLWMAQGFLNPSPRHGTQRMEMEDIGKEYFDTLLEKSLFQDAKKNEVDVITECKMHDLVHEFATEVSRCESWTQDFNHEMDDSEIRHVAWIPTPESMPDFNHEMDDSEIPHVIRIPTPSPESMPETSVARLRSLFSNVKVFNIISPKLRALRVLSFYEAETQELPNSFDKLKHLRYLDLSDTEISELPKSIGKLYNLQTLRLPYLDKCPKEIQNLIKLRHLYFYGRMKFEAGSLRRLTDLRRLPYFNVGLRRPPYFNVGPAIEELGELNQLRGHLIIDELENVRDGEEAKNARLVQKSHLHELTFEWTYGGVPNENQTDVLDGLEPHGGLQTLNIEYFMGARFPSWIESLQNLKEIRLVGCNNCEGVPTLGHLPKLRSLMISKMDKLKRVGAEFYGTPATSFPALKTLNIVECKELIEWMEAPAEGEVAVFPCLEELILRECPNLRNAPSRFPCLKTLEIYQTGLTCLPEGMLKKNKSLTYLYIDNCDELTCIAPDVFGCCESLRSLIVNNCGKLSHLPDGLDCSTSLQKLEIVGCNNLTSIPITEGIPSLQILTIASCQRLLSLPSGLRFCTSLQDLRITYCSSLVSISVSYHVCDHPDSTNQPEQVFTGLVQYLSIPEDCRSLESIPADLRQPLICDCGKLKYGPTGFHRLTRLMNLSIGAFWEELEAFPDFQLPPPHDSQLELLILTGWPKLKSLPPQIQHLTCLKSLWICEYMGLEALPEWLGNLTSLESLGFWSCENLRSLPGLDAMRSLTELKLLDISRCPLLEKRCTKETGPEWPKISHIPQLYCGESDESSENSTSSPRNAMLGCLPCFL